ncbi:hypothetical protein B0H63DRAFT_18555 [Podospora didyma]|uniref:Uncharacterized protein n=1 Tax=Podospora didyma TaxID=330526 RepID=A0AAE0U7K2_9PEZI|nr:hypothetical protein B0H63DRAFT_18555 [Podospora didyma]
MAPGLDKLERRLDRLEKFFSKKRKAPGNSLDNMMVPSLSISTRRETGFQTFPQPSFIRPTSTRMLARDEPLRARRAHSLPESPNKPGLGSSNTSSDTTPTTPTGLRDHFPSIPQRSSSLCRQDTAFTLAELLDFSFPSHSRRSEVFHTPDPLARYRSRSGSRSKSRSASASVSPKAQVDRKRRVHEPCEQAAMAHQQYPITPPLSAHHDGSFSSMHFYIDKHMIDPHGNPTPETSPRLIPLPDPKPNELELDQTVRSQRPKSLDAAACISHGPAGTLRRATSLSTLPKLSTPTAASEISLILREPTFGDFLSLSDDDIADGQPIHRPQLTPTSKAPACALPPNPPALLMSLPHISNCHPLLTLSPPLSTRPATTAAFEAARIAARYKFDMVYVVNLWPTHMGSSRRRTRRRTVPKRLSLTSNGATASPNLPTPSPKNTSANEVERVSLAPDSPPANITGRLLAAYGLSTMRSPFRVSAPVLQMVLRDGSWSEYRNDGAAKDELARGYSCSFYTGHSPDRRMRNPNAEGDTGSPTEASPKKGKARAPNRGIVFAAYRLPRADGTTLASSPAELESLRKDAETLVDMSIDIHQTPMRRRSSTKA